MLGFTTAIDQSDSGTQPCPVFETHAGPSAQDHQLWRRSSNSSEFVACRSTKCLKQGIKMCECLKIKLH